MSVIRRERKLIKNQGAYCEYPPSVYKKCKTCGIQKENIEANFRFTSRAKQGSPDQIILIHPHSRLANECRECEANRQKERSKTPKGKEKARLWKQNNRDKINELNRNRIKQKLKDPEYAKEYKLKNKTRYNNNREKFLDIAKKYRENNRTKTRQTARKYYWKNKEYINKRASEWRKRVRYSSSRQKKDPIYKLKCECRGRINWLTNRRRKVLNYNKTCSQTEKLIGCSVKFYYKHIEKQFVENMHWNNYGEWHVDHIIPLAAAKTKEEVLALNLWSNLQPLWSSDNIKKGSKILDTSLYDYFTREISEPGENL
jgi:hypothetical protein